MAVATFQRLVNTLGTPKDTPDLRDRPALFMYSLERWLLPRHHLLKVLKEKGLLNFESDYYYTASMAEKMFVRKFVLPFKDQVQGLADDYAFRCSGKPSMNLLDKKFELDDAKASSGKV